MELIAKIENIGGMTQSQFKDKKTNEIKIFKRIGVTLRCGKDLIYAEAVQEQAAVLLMDVSVNKTVEAGKSYFVRLAFTQHDYTDQQGNTRYSTDVRLMSWEPMS